MRLQDVREAIEYGTEKLPWIAASKKRAWPSKLGWVALGAAAASLGTAAFRMKATAHHGSGKRVRDVMIDKVITVPESASLAEAAQRMRDSNVGALPVLEGDEVVGVVTDRDLVIRGLARHPNASSVTVGEVSTKILVRAHPDWDVDEAMRVMAEHRIGRLPVVDESRRVVGMVTLSSLALRSGEETEALETAQQVSRRSARA